MNKEIIQINWIILGIFIAIVSLLFRIIHEAKANKSNVWPNWDKHEEKSVPKPVLKTAPDDLNDFWPDKMSQVDLSAQCYVDMKKKICRMSNSELVDELSEIIPLCIYANEWYAENHPGINLSDLKELAENKAKTAR